MAVRIPVGIESDLAANYPQSLNVRERKLLEAAREDRNIDLSFKSAVVTSRNDSVGAILPTENAAAKVAVHSIDGVVLEQYMAVVESTGTATYSFPYVSADGLELPLLGADPAVDGVTEYELCTGILARNPGVYTVGSFPGGKSIFIEATVKIDDISDLQQLAIGFRKREAYQANIDSYDELAAMHVGETGATVADGQINIMTIINNASTVYTDTTLTDWADAGEHTLRVEVANNGICSFSYDGAAPTVTKAFTFDSGEVLVPFVRVENTAGSTTGDPGVSMSALQIGLK